MKIAALLIASVQVVFKVSQSQIWLGCTLFVVWNITCHPCPITIQESKRTVYGITPLLAKKQLQIVCKKWFKYTHFGLKMAIQSFYHGLKAERRCSSRKLITTNHRGLFTQRSDRNSVWIGQSSQCFWTFKPDVGCFTHFTFLNAIKLRSPWLILTERWAHIGLHLQNFADLVFIRNYRNM